MKKGYYIHFQGRQSIGVSKKIDMQIEELQTCFEVQEAEVPVVERSLMQRLVGLLPMNSIARDYESVLEKLDQPDFLYVRRTVADKAYVSFFQKIKERFPACKILIEIFTYPYDRDDFGKWNAWPFFLKECLYRPKLKRCVDRFITYSEDEEIFGIPTIRTINGINMERTRQVFGEYINRRLVLIGVAYMQRQHGYERVIKGLSEYYQKESADYEVLLYLVGEGPEKEKYQKLVSEYQLEPHVKFYPATTGKALDCLYDQADLALAAFGMYKVGFDGELSALKTRECLAKGMPMITGTKIDVLDTDSDYAQIFPNDSSPIDIGEVINYFERLKKTYKSKQSLAKTLRAYADETVSMARAMKPVVEYIGRE